MHSTRDKDASARARRISGFTIVELMLGIAILGVLVGIAYPSYQQYTERVRIAQAIIDIQGISASVEAYSNDNREYPADLNEVGKSGMKDPWGNAYRYTNLGAAKGVGKARKNKNLVPINSDFDLYSMGKDGASVSPLTAKASRDDIVRANNGRFVGLASDYDP
jgi:general secretion pathway protein G